MTTLDPYIPGGAISKWFEYFETVSPDVAKKEINMVKIAGGMALNTMAKVIFVPWPVLSGNGIIAPVGPTGSAKSWLVEHTSLFFAGEDTIPEGTPQYIAEVIEKRKVGIYTIPEVGEALSAAEKGGYMANWGYLLNRIYDLDKIELGRRQAKKTVMVPRRSYYVSAMIAGLPEDFKGIFDIWKKGLKRRFLFLPITTEAPDTLYDIDDSVKDMIIESIWLQKFLKRIMVIVNYDKNMANKYISSLHDKIRDPDMRKKIRDYSVKLLGSWALDHALALLVQEFGDFDSVSIGNKNSVVEGKGVRIELLPQKEMDYFIHRIESPNYNILKPALFFKNLIDSISPEMILCISVGPTETYTVIRHFGDLLTEITESPLVMRVVAQVPGGRDGGRYEAILNRVSDMLERHGIISHSKLLKNLYNVKAKELGEVIDTLKQRGEVVVRKSGRTRYYLKPSLRICGTCALFHRPGCPEESEDTLRVGGMMNVDDEACERWTPLWGEEG